MLQAQAAPVYATIGDPGPDTPLINRNVPPEAAFSAQSTTDLPWRLHADKMVSLDDGVIVEASGDVLLTRGNDYLRADFARFFTATNWIFIQGDVHVRLGQDELTATEAEFDLISNTGWLKNGHIFMAGPHIYFTGESVIKHWGDSYTFENAKITACDGPIPAWSLTAEQAQVEIDGYATLTRSQFQVRDRGVLFAPWMILPAKTTRQSGLLQPSVGMSSLQGFYYTQPWYWAWDESRDMTFYLTWMERIGFMPSIEYRSHTGDNAKTWASVDVLYDDNVFRLDSQDPIDSSDGKVRTNYLRYWLRAMSDGYVGDSPWRYKYNLDYASDQNFLREFQNRMTGFDSTRDSMVDMFGRDLQEVDKNRVTEGYLFRDWDRFRLALGGRYEQDPSLGHGNAGLSTDTTVQILPQFSAYWFKSRLIPDLPLEVEGESTTSYMYRRMGASGLRTEIYPRLTLPLDLKYATLLASGGLRQTFYYNNTVRATSPFREGVTSNESHGGTTRTLPEVNLTLFTQGSRIWDFAPTIPLQATPQTVGQSQWTGLRHTIQPRIDYDWTPNVDQKDNPFYTLDDRIRASNTFYFTLTNLLTVRRQTVVADPAPEGEEPTSASLVPDYYELLRFRLGTGYDFEEAQRSRHRDLFERHPAMDLMTDFTLNLKPWASLWAQNYVSLYGDGITRSDYGLTLSHNRWGEWNTSYSSRSNRYNYLRRVQYENLEDIRFEEPLNLWRNELSLYLNPRWQLGAVSHLDLDRGKQYETRFSLSYIHQCYRITGRFVSKGSERSYHISIELLGFN